MGDIAKDYALADATSSAELKRPREIDDYMRPTTEAGIARLGIAPGWKCLFRESLRDTPLCKPKPIGSLHRFGCDEPLVTLAERHWRFGSPADVKGCSPSMRNDRPLSALPRECQCKARRACIAPSVAGSIMQQALEKDTREH